MHYSVSLIGTGNVAWHLSQALEKAGHQVREIYGRNPEHAERVAEKLYDAQVVTSLDFSESESTVFLLCVSDDAIGRVADQIILPDEDAILCHTSGTQPLDLLAGRSYAGVFYPLQTFTRNHRLDLATVPFCIEATNELTRQVLVGIAQTISRTVYLVDAQERKMLHVGAVFACNFTNHLLALSKHLLAQEGLEFSLLKPLIRETFEKALEVADPATVQTGPAIREDYQVIHAHLDYLQRTPHWQALYKLITDSIVLLSRRG
ncbi:MAG: DUF2520 domain-containing protein [Cytophagales bacterium]|nr:DUF2520 domain-containing protein [Cytophagales bacterium]